MIVVIQTLQAVQCGTVARAHVVASVPGSLPYACAIFTYDLWTPRNEKSGREPGLFYHVSDVEGREKVERT